MIMFLSVNMNAFSAHALDEKRQFSYYAENQNITAVLSAFASAQNLIPHFSNQVTGNISGKFENVISKDFLDSMQQAFGIAWFELAGTLYFYHQSEMQRSFVSTKVIPAAELLRLLKNSAIISPRLPVKIMSADMLVINGPSAYLQQIQAAISAFERAQLTNFTMEVFPLKYAWADDITVTSMDTQVTIPGVATILQAMVSGANITASEVTQLPSSVNPLLGQGLNARDQVSQAPQATTQQALNQGGENTNPVSIIADPRVNAVIITDAAYRMNYYKKVIADLDKPVELVEIHAAIVDIDSSYNRSLGINLQGSFGGGDVTTGGSSGQEGNYSPLQSAGQILSSGLNLSTLYSSGADFFLAQVEALEEDNNARVLGKPSVLTMDNIQATLENTSTYYVEVGGKDVADLFKVEAGTVLKVTPHIIHNDNGTQSIKLVVNVQDDQSDGSTSSAAVGALPPIKQTKINTQAIVNEGQSLLIGGYYYEQAQEGDSGVPGLRKIPILGNLFKTKTKATQKMERLILITPRIVRLDEKYEIPARVDEARFSRSPTQSDYVERVPQVQQTSGCSKSPRVEDANTL